MGVTDEAVCPDWMNVFRYTDGFRNMNVFRYTDGFRNMNVFRYTNGFRHMNVSTEAVAEG